MIGRTWRLGALGLACLFVLGSLVPGARAAGATVGWATRGTQILDPSGNPFAVTGINWYGFETRGAVAHGMWTKDYR